MGHRRLFSTSQTSDMGSGNMWNHPSPNHHLQIDNAAVGGLNPMPLFDNMPRSNGIQSSNVYSDIPNYRAANTGTSHDHYLHPSLGSSDQRRPTYVHTATDRCASGNVSSSVNTQMDYRRLPSKRKNPALSMTFDRGSTSTYHRAGSSSSLSMSYNTTQPNPSVGPQCRAWNPISMLPNHQSNYLLASGEGSHRNVRSRQSHAIHLENHPIQPLSLGNLPPHHIHPMANIPGLAAAAQWSHAPVSFDTHSRIISSDVGCFNYESSQSVAGSSVANSSMGTSGAYYPSIVQSRSSNTPLPTPHGPLSQVIGVERGSNGQRAAPCRAISSYQPVGFAAPFEGGRRLGMGTIPPSRHGRPPSAIEQSSERNGRSRHFSDRFQPFVDTDNVFSMWVSEVVSVDHSTFYDSRNLFDQHHDMRLDIDNMSYEELLALEERIGNVNTGLSEDAISKCVMESVYCSSDHIQDDVEKGNCVICMEEHKDGESSGRLSCGHDFHAGCIKEWLVIKNFCPICKASALRDTKEE